MVILNKDVIKKAQIEPKTMPTIYPPDDCRLGLIVSRLKWLRASSGKRK